MRRNAAEVCTSSLSLAPVDPGVGAELTDEVLLSRFLMRPMIGGDSSELSRFRPGCGNQIGGRDLAIQATVTRPSTCTYAALRRRQITV
jgi:hypothetical protein